uniref:hypothetical protein n=1 Tax=uncultured Draconibacterium sp. TaxID=1573823 RepID=UPI003217EBB4
MKKLFYLFFIIALSSCSKDDPIVPNPTFSFDTSNTQMYNGAARAIPNNTVKLSIKNGSYELEDETGSKVNASGNSVNLSNLGDGFVRATFYDEAGEYAGSKELKTDLNNSPLLNNGVSLEIQKPVTDEKVQALKQYFTDEESDDFTLSLNDNKLTAKDNFGASSVYDVTFTEKPNEVPTVTRNLESDFINVSPLSYDLSKAFTGTDTDGTIVQTEYFKDGTSIGTNPIVNETGSYTAKVTDDKGAVSNMSNTFNLDLANLKFNLEGRLTIEKNGKTYLRDIDTNGPVGYTSNASFDSQEWFDGSNTTTGVEYTIPSEIDSDKEISFKAYIDGQLKAEDILRIDKDSDHKYDVNNQGDFTEGNEIRHKVYDINLNLDLPQLENMLDEEGDGVKKKVLEVYGTGGKLAMSYELEPNTTSYKLNINDFNNNDWNGFEENAIGIFKVKTVDSNGRVEAYNPNSLKVEFYAD